MPLLAGDAQSWVVDGSASQALLRDSCVRLQPSDCKCPQKRSQEQPTEKASTQGAAECLSPYLAAMVVANW